MRKQPVDQKVRGGRPKVTVMIITYNHAKYIAEALDSVLEQRTEFPFAIHVIDDCSTDGTSDIVRDYAARYPGVVKAFINEKNIGSEVTQRNFYRGMKTLDGDYIAILEGDDYWASPDRLQTHVAFLEENPDFVACANDTLKIYEDGSEAPHIFQPPPQKDVHDINELIMLSSFFHASSLTFRNVFRGKVPRYLRSPLSCDIFVTIAHAQHGKVRYFPHAWSVYRAHGAGLFSQMSQTKGWMWNIDSMRAYNRWLRFRHLPVFAKSIYHYCDRLLANGRAEDGLTPEKRAFYAKVRRTYRRVDQVCRWIDVWLARRIPGRRARSAPARLNLGCGYMNFVQYVNVDIRCDVDADMVVDLEKTPWPWPDNYAKEVRFERSLEHLGGDLKTFQAIMRELYRVCQPGATVTVIAKHPRNDSFVNDPSCVRVVSPAVLALFDSQTPPYPDPAPLAERNKVDFEIVQRNVQLAEPYRTRFQTGQLSYGEIAQLIDSSFNVCSEFQAELRVHKPPRPAMSMAAAAAAAAAQNEMDAQVEDATETAAAA